MMKRIVFIILMALIISLTGCHGTVATYDSAVPDDTVATQDSDAPDDTAATQDSAAPDDAVATQDSEAPDDTAATQDSAVPDDTESIYDNAITNITMSGDYIANVNSKKLHYYTCTSLPKEHNRVYFSTVEEAHRAGYTDHHRECMGD